MAADGFGSTVLIIVQILMVLSVVVTFILVVKLPTIKLKTRAAYIGVTANAALIGAYYILKYLVF
jgi:hypothetical protein